MHFYSSVMPSPPLKTAVREFLIICFPQDKMDGGNYDVFNQNSIRKYEEDLEH